MTRHLRSRSVRLALAGAAALSLSACKSDEVDTQVFPDEAACRNASEKPGAAFTAADCETAYAQALTAYEDTAPHYGEKALCEEQHDGACVQQTSPSGGSFFMPLLAGYMIGNMLGGRGMSSQPLFRTSDGKFSTASGSTVLNGNSGRTNLSQNAFKAQPSTARAAPMTRAMVAARGGFGAARTSGGGIRSGG